MTCAKVVVTAVLTSVGGAVYVGRNDCATPQVVCPRGGMAHGQGYELCRTVCRQGAHAEVRAIRAAGLDAVGGQMVITGHDRQCVDCRLVTDMLGIEVKFA